jgi:hypothetical protein
VIASAVVALLALSSCGVSGGDDVAATDTLDRSTTTEAETTDTTEADDGEASTTTADDGGDDEGSTTTTADEPETTDTTGGGLGGQDDMMRDALIQGFQSAGFTAEQATCLADGYIEMGITDPEASADIDVMGMMDLFSQCGVSMEDLGELGAGMGA